MLRMEQVHVIRHKVLVEGRSARQVAREMGISRNTVAKYLESAEPVRKEEQRRVKPVRARVRERIESLLEEWKPKTTRRQRITGARILRQLQEEGYRVGRTTVQQYLAEWRRQRAEVYIPLVHRPGEEAQVDFFEVTVAVAGLMRKAWLFVLRLMYSGRDFAWIYDRCDQVSFLDGHVRAFAHFGAVPQRAVYDNLRPAVRRIVLAERELTGRFQALVSHYLYEPCFARPGEGHDKGGVEGRGRGGSGSRSSRRFRRADRFGRSRRGCWRGSTPPWRLARMSWGEPWPSALARRGNFSCPCPSRSRRAARIRSASADRPGSG
jgi:transposase